MSKNNLTEQEVKSILKIDSFRNLSKDKIMDFISLIPSMDKDVAVAIINQFPAFSRLSESMVEQLSKMCDSAIKENTTSESAVFSAYRKILDDLGEILKRENITPEERDALTNKMVEIADKMAEKDTENKQFLAWIVKNKSYIISGVMLLGAALLGVNVKGKSIPRLK